MAWQDDLVNGEFAGVRVYWPESHREFGRNVVNRKIPNADEIHSKDLGKHPDEWQIEFFVKGPDYMIDRDELVEKLSNQRGPYAMVDPWFGEFTVELHSKIQLTQRTSEGGIARFRFTVILAKQLAFPVIHEPSGNLKAKVTPVKIAAEGKFKNKMSLGKFKRLVTSALGTATIAMGVVNGKVNSVLGFGSDLSNEIDAIDGQLNKLVQAPQQLANTLQGMWDSLFQLVQDIKEASVPFGLDDGIGRGRGDLDPLVILSDMMRTGQEIDTGADDVNPTLGASVDGALLVENLKAIQTLTQMQTLASGCEQLAELEPSNDQFAAEMSDQMLAWFDTLLAEPSLEADEAEALKDLKAAALDYLIVVGQRAPEVAEVYLPEPVPALVLAHQFFGDATRADEIVARNAPPNPMLISGTIKVVQDG